MSHNWIITNKKMIKTDYKKANTSDSFYLFTDDNRKIYSSTKNNNIKIIIDGSVIPRNAYFSKLRKYKPFDLIDILYHKYGDRFTDYIKGNFNILIFQYDQFVIVNDHHSLNKFYYYNKNKNFIISNNYSQLINTSNYSINKLAGALFALFQHFVEGQTIFKDVLYSRPSTLVSFKSMDICINQYWDRLSLIKNNTNKNDINKIIENFNEVIKNYISYYNSKKIHLTQTGGRDTRTILAALLANGYKPNLFTFGFPKGRDIIVSKKISKKLNLEFHNPYISDPNYKKYQKLVDEISLMNNPLINLHRSHRLDAIKKQKKKYKSIDMLFMGAMGGDYIKGVSFNDYIVSKFFRKYFSKSEDYKKNIKQILDENFIKYDDELLNNIYKIVKEITIFKQENFKEKEFLIAFDIIGSIHDTQDIEIFRKYSDHVICPFMDIDFLEILFNSKFSMLHNNRDSKNLFKQLQGGELQATMIKSFSPKLANIEFASGYTANELLGNKIIYLMKRLYYKLFKIKSYSTFPYGNWFNPFVLNNIKNIDKRLLSQYNIKQLIQSLNSSKKSNTEGYWHKFTNSINLSNILKGFLNK